MSLLSKNPHLIKEVVEISEHAGRSILEIYNNSNLDFQLTLNSLFTQAIKDGLENHDLSAMHKIFKTN